jgi:hypothetical protein
MNRQTGIWIDTTQAVIISLEENRHTVQVIESGIAGRVRIPGEKKWFTRFGNQFLDFDKKKENRKEQEIRNYLKRVTAFLQEGSQPGRQSTELVLFGPAGMKTVIAQMLMDTNLPAITVNGIETTDNMTENQKVAWVKQYFQK